MGDGSILTEILCDLIQFWYQWEYSCLILVFSQCELRILRHRSRILFFQCKHTQRKTNFSFDAIFVGKDAAQSYGLNGLNKITGMIHWPNNATSFQRCVRLFWFPGYSLFPWPVFKEWFLLEPWCSKHLFILEWGNMEFIYIDFSILKRSFKVSDGMEAHGNKYIPRQTIVHF